MAKSFRIKDGKFLIVDGKFAVGEGACGCCGFGACCPTRSIAVEGLLGGLAHFNGVIDGLTVIIDDTAGYCAYVKYINVEPFDCYDYHVATVSLATYPDGSYFISIETLPDYGAAYESTYADPDERIHVWVSCDDGGEDNDLHLTLLPCVEPEPAAFEGGGGGAVEMEGGAGEDLDLEG